MGENYFLQTLNRTASNNVFYLSEKHNARIVSSSFLMTKELEQLYLKNNTRAILLLLSEFYFSNKIYNKLFERLCSNYLFVFKGIQYTRVV